jgi:beta-galactosidase
MTNTALGMKGANYYIFTGGPNPAGVSHQGDIYDYGASISAFGEIRPTYAAQKEYGQFLADHSWLAGAEREADFYIGLDWEQSRSRHYAEDSGESMFSNTEAWSFVRKGILTTAFCASYSANFVDLSNLDAALSTKKPLVVAASTCMAADRQMALVRYVEQGGSLMLGPVIPWMDENIQPCTILSDYLQATGFQRFTKTSPVVTVGSVHNILMNGSLWTNTSRPPMAQTIAFEDTTRQELGWMVQMPSGGSVVWLGFDWKHSKHEHTDALRYLLAKLGCEEPLVRCSNPNVWTSLRSDGKNRMLFVMNLLSARMSTDVAIRANDGTYSNSVHVELKPMEVIAAHID